MAVNNKSVTTLTAGRVARLLHLHSNTVRRWSDRGVIEPCHVTRNGARRFLRADITRLLLQVNGNGGSPERTHSISHGDVFKTESREYSDVPLPIRS